MKLAAWRKEKGWTQDQLADHLGVGQPYISRIERPARAKGFVLPNLGILLELYVISGGDVTPNDFCDLPSLQAQRKAA